MRFSLRTMRFSLRTLHVVVLMVFVLMVVTVTIPAMWQTMLKLVLLELTAVTLVVVAVYGGGKLRAFAIGGLAAVVLPWLHRPPASGLGLLEMQLIGLPRYQLVTVLSGLAWLVSQILWIGGCGCVAVYVAGQLERHRSPQPPPVSVPGTRDTDRRVDDSSIG